MSTRETLFGLNIRDGRVVVALDRPYPIGPAEISKLAVEIPDLSFPFDLSGGAERFRHHRGTMLNGQLSFAEASLAKWLAQRLSEVRAGYDSLRVAIREQCVNLTGIVTLESHRSEFLIRGFVSVGDGRVRVCFNDIRLFAPFPLPAPLVANGLLRATLPPQPNPAVHSEIVGVTDALIEPLLPILRHGLPQLGWRAPETDEVRLVGCQADGGSLDLIYKRASEARDATHERPALSDQKRRLLAHQEAKGLFHSLEEGCRYQITFGGGTTLRRQGRTALRPSSADRTAAFNFSARARNSTRKRKRLPSPRSQDGRRSCPRITRLPSSVNVLATTTKHLITTRKSPT